MNDQPKFSCPICSADLVKTDKTLKCASNHSFDYAKEGYVNLLPVQLKKSLNPGDDLNMVIARREFLQLGHYEFMRNKLIELVTENAPQLIVDLGCGEGYYTSEIKAQQKATSVYGIDISKSAVKYAAKRNKEVHYAVATNAHLPFSDKSVDLIVNVFAPLIGKECQRILDNNGKILAVSPGPSHLLEIKQVIYPTAELHEAPRPPEFFENSASWNVKNTITISSSEQLNNLLTMTPFGWKTSEESLQKLQALLPLTVTLDFIISQYIPNASLN
ncbi:putative RNA methyltransferase [Psychrosphaera aestuarii]|uniref:putative RNA methyltransferase n=1 Tax=Psychrosphaera aestuarii TaxID=1266052 RepID=UPI001B34012B|nr:methyltransferase domain-containing protein [Psychrosphaera aestuarii]